MTAPPSPTPQTAPRRVLLFSGHMVDAPGRASERFPARLVPAAAQRIAAALDALSAGPQDLAIAQAAAGGDLLFLEACVERGVPCRVLLPLPLPQFIAQSVRPSAGGARWKARFDALREHLAEPMQVIDEVLGPTLPGTNPWVRGMQWMLDSALAHGARRVHLICLWDGGGGDGPGGTAHTVDAVRRHGGHVTWIDIRTVAEQPMPPRRSRPASLAHPPEETRMSTTPSAVKSTAARRKALALNIGLNGVDPKAYAGWSGPLAACEFDAHDMTALAKSRGMKPTTLLTRQATRAKVLAGIRAAAAALKSGDLFFLSYSGHGGQVPDVSGDEADKQDETWCLYDGQLIDDELYFELSRFGAGVRVLVLSDSCHSGTVTREGPPAAGTPQQRPKLMPAAVGLRTYRDHRAFYDKLQADVVKAAGDAPVDPDSALAQVAASGRLSAIVKSFQPAVLLISGCQDNQTSMDGEHNGAFTEQLLKVWNHGAFSGNYANFHARIRAGMPPTQSPNLFTLGDAAAFLSQAPFSV